VYTIMVLVGENTSNVLGSYGANFFIHYVKCKCHCQERGTVLRTWDGKVLVFIVQ
jgi:hypothetical protein